MDLFSFFNHADPTNDAGYDVNEEVAADGQENPVKAEIVRLIVTQYFACQSLCYGGGYVVVHYFFCIAYVEALGGGRTDSLTGTSLRTQHPAERSLISDHLVMTTSIVTTVFAIASFVSVPRAGDEPVHASIYGFHLRWYGRIGYCRPFSSSWEKKKLEGRCSRHANLLKAEAAKAIRLHGQLLRDKILSDKVAELDFDLLGMALHLDEEFYPCFLTTIAGWRWILGRGLRLVVMKYLQSPEYLAALGRAIGRAIDKGRQDGLAACIDHGNGGRGLVDVAAYNPFAEANYFSVVNALRVTISILSILVADYEVSGAELTAKVPSPPKIVFEKEELETTPERTTAN
nr:hypothetical protein [Tanacetum cinerariifolium]